MKKEFHVEYNFKAWKIPPAHGWRLLKLQIQQSKLPKVFFFFGKKKLDRHERDCIMVFPRQTYQLASIMERREAIHCCVFVCSRYYHCCVNTHRFPFFFFRWQVCFCAYQGIFFSPSFIGILLCMYSRLTLKKYSGERRYVLARIFSFQEVRWPTTNSRHVCEGILYILTPENRKKRRQKSCVATTHTHAESIVGHWTLPNFSSPFSLAKLLSYL